MKLDLQPNLTSYKTKTKRKKPSLSIVNAGPLDIMYLYYPLNVEGVTLTGSLLPANASKTWVISKNKVFTNTNREYIYMNVIFEDLCEFLQNRIADQIGKNKNKLLQKFPIQVNK